ncbi:MAG: hypothetical protein DRP68_01565 [Candidatus Omnitrophota bacterium]|nr:MAG: hypothetical protein DRP68_01565 [Candidatus Omnitrophota bacterium]RKY44544.1 MAG: hypothetical protein DRP81_05405 [Candidatus Omnitrophota bacterium]HDN86330.1 PilZ domain-containing protein [Candidatus Omnitrophota bacterium]
MKTLKGEKRRFARIKLPCQITITTSKILTYGYTEDISVGGIRVATYKKLTNHSLVNLEIYAVKNDPIICKGKVVWAERKKVPYNNGSLFNVGIKFWQIKKEDREAIKSLIECIDT